MGKLSRDKTLKLLIKGQRKNSLVRLSAAVNIMTTFFSFSGKIGLSVFVPGKT
jgi:hypothetical protein